MPERTRRAWRRAALAGAAMLALAGAASPRAAAAQQRDTTARPTTVSAPTDPRLVPGTRVRVTLRRFRGARMAGRIDSVLASAFVLDTSDRRSILFIAPGPELLPQYRRAQVRFDDVQRIEVSRGTSRLRGAVIGGLIGAAVGGLLTGLNDSPQLNPSGRDVGNAAASGIIVGGLVGGIAGYFMGRERWAPVAWP